mgnify:CR=1 FL=1|tara:strand:- start:38 stop:562 length:525 start_codon:yes stop_codon:yes gene_type:complete
MKTNNKQYNKTKKAISNIDCPNRLLTLADNIENCVAKDNNLTEFLTLSTEARKKANDIGYGERPDSFEIKSITILPKPKSNNRLEEIAYNSFFKPALELGLRPSNRVIYWQINKLGYAQTLIKQVINKVASPMFHKLVELGLEDLTAENFVSKYARHLVPTQVLAKVDEVTAYA